MRLRLRKLDIILDNMAGTATQLRLMICENDYSMPEEICEEVTSDGSSTISTDHGSPITDYSIDKSS